MSKPPFTIETELTVLREFVEKECSQRFEAPLEDGQPTEPQGEALRAVAAANRLCVWLGVKPL